MRKVRCTSKTFSFSPCTCFAVSVTQLTFSMLSRHAPSAFLCFRCEARFLRLRYPISPYQAPLTRFSTSIFHRDDANLQPTLSEVPQPASNNAKESISFVQSRRRKGKVIRETSRRTLEGLTQLGDDADILVLKEVEGIDKDESSTEPEKLEPIDLPDIVASLDVGSPSTDELHGQIESLRPEITANANEPQYLTQAEFAKLTRRLMDGFTHAQLSSFYANTKDTQQEKPSKKLSRDVKAGTGTEERLIVRTQWQPGTTALHKRLPRIDIAQARSKGNSANKQLLVDRILRVAWNLAPLEEIELPGQLELALKPWQIKLLNCGGNDSLPILDLVAILIYLKKRIQFSVEWLMLERQH